MRGHAPARRRFGLLLAVLAATLFLPGGGRAAEPVAAVLGSDGIQRAAITADSYVFVPAHLIVQAGKPVELLLTSVTIITPHNFIVHDAAAGMAIDQDIGPGKSVTVTFTPTRPGTYTFYCDKKLPFFPSHRDKGMEGRLDVQ
jgi:plastocyanin